MAVVVEVKEGWEEGGREGWRRKRREEVEEVEQVEQEFGPKCFIQQSQKNVSRRFFFLLKNEMISLSCSRGRAPRR